MDDTLSVHDFLFVCFCFYSFFFFFLVGGGISRFYEGLIDLVKVKFSTISTKLVLSVLNQCQKSVLNPIFSCQSFHNFFKVPQRYLKKLTLALL